MCVSVADIRNRSFTNNPQSSNGIELIQLHLEKGNRPVCVCEKAYYPPDQLHTQYVSNLSSTPENFSRKRFIGPIFNTQNCCTVPGKSKVANPAVNKTWKNALADSVCRHRLGSKSTVRCATSMEPRRSRLRKPQTFSALG